MNRGPTVSSSSSRAATDEHVSGAPPGLTPEMMSVLLSINESLTAMIILILFVFRSAAIKWMQQSGGFSSGRDAAQ